MFELSYTLIIVVLGTMILGSVAGMLGTLVVLRRQALVGDALSHATLPGVVIAFMLMPIRSLEFLLVGAFVSAVIAMVLLDVIKHYTRIKFDASMALILSSFFGFGQVLLSHLQKTGGSSQAGLSRFIFGQAATLLRSDVYLLAGVAMVLSLLMVLFWKELKLFIFDEPFFISLGFNRRVINGLITFMIVIIITVGIRMVGVILMSALLIAPSIAARQLSSRYTLNIFLAAITGGVAGAIGTVISSSYTNMPTGPVIVIVLGVVVLASVLLSPKTGLIKRAIQNRLYKTKIKHYRSLIHLYENPSETKLDPERHTYFLEHNYLKRTNGTLEITPKGLSKIRSIKGVDNNEY